MASPYNDRVALADTTETARQRQLAVYAATSGADKVMIAMQMAEQTKQIALDGIRSRHPDLNAADVHRQWLIMLHGNLADTLAQLPVTKAH